MLFWPIVNGKKKSSDLDISGAALAVAVMVLILAAYDHSPLLIVVLAATAVYITTQDTPYDRYRS